MGTDQPAHYGGAHNLPTQFEINENSRRRDRNRMIQESQLLQLFHELDIDHDGRIPAMELSGRIQSNAAHIGLSTDQLRQMITYADKNSDSYIDYGEFSLLMTSIKKQTMTHAMLRAGQLVTPKGQRVEKFTYLEQYTCCPPPFAMIVISIIEIAFYIYYVATDEKNTGIAINGPVPTHSWAIYNPYRRAEVWRFLSYMLIHIGIYHIVFNVLTQLLIGLPLELVHKFWRITIVYMGGVLAGSLAVSVTDPYVYLAGASGGVYALIAAHAANLVVNWAEMEFAIARLIILVVLVGSDVGIALYNRYENPEGNKVSYVAHIGGFIAGLLLGIVVLRNFKLRAWERIVWWASLVTFIILLLACIIFNLTWTGYPPQQV